MNDEDWTLGGALSSMRSGLADWRDSTFGPIRTSLEGAKREAMGSLYRPDKYGSDAERERDDPVAEIRAAMAATQDPAKREALRQSFNYAQRRPAFNPNPVGPVPPQVGATMGGPMGFQANYDPFRRRPV